MPTIYRHNFTVPPRAIDLQGHVNNQEYLRWMQAVAIAHSTAQRWPLERYLEAGQVWVVRSHYIEYLSPAFENETLSLYTWVADINEKRSTRKYLFTRGNHHQTAARAETLWVFVTLKTGNPCPIPGELRGAFVPMADQRQVLRRIRNHEVPPCVPPGLHRRRPPIDGASRLG